MINLTGLGQEVGELFRKATRPIVTVIFAVAIYQVVVGKIDAPQWFIGIAVTVILSWFGVRTAQAVKEVKAK